MKLDLAFVAFKNSFLGRHIRSTLEATLVAYIERTAPVDTVLSLSLLTHSAPSVPY
jgi:hypothetical protein